MSLFTGRKPAKPFVFDSEYRSSESSGPSNKSSERGLVSFFDDEPVEQGPKTEWTSNSAPEEDLQEGMDDYTKGKDEETDDIKYLIASMPHNASKSDRHKSDS